MPTRSVNQYQNFLDEGQYNENGLKRYEWIFGEGYLSTGGFETTREIVPYLDLKVGSKILDVGCGLGGHDIYMAETYGAIIDAIDLSTNTIAVARRHLAKRPHIASNIYFRICDVNETNFEENYYDVIYSRDALLHIKEKSKLFQRCLKWLKPGGKLVFTDYCRGTGKQSDEFERYVKQRDYTLYEVEQYGNLIKSCGFVNVVAVDIKHMFDESLKRELNKLLTGKEEFLALFSEKDFNDLKNGWLAKIERAKEGSQTWGLFRAQKPV